MKTISFSLMWIILLLVLLFAAEKINSIEVPQGYQRLSFPANSYSHYIQNLPLKADNIIYKWDGGKVWYAMFVYKVLAVVDKPLLFKEDLEQCADYPMRFWAEYHKDTGILDKLYLYDYSGHKKYYKDAGKSWLKYLHRHLAFSNSFSLKEGCDKIDATEKLIPGDMFVQNTDGGVGHVSLVVDAAENAAGNRIYLIGYSYMPAQEFHIEDADNQDDADAWFTKEGYIQYLADSRLSQYGTPVLRRF